MFRKLIVASSVLALSSGVAFAHGKGMYKDYKNEAACPVCTTTLAAGPYLGLSIGPMVNIMGNGSNFAGFTGVLSGGYGMFWDRWYLAGEIFGQGTAKMTVAGTINPQTTWDWGVSALPGYMITNDVLAYLRAGYIQMHFNHLPGSTNKSGWQVGAGAETNLWDNWDIRAEYDYAQFSKVSGIGTPRSNQFLAGLVYKFM